MNQPQAVKMIEVARPERMLDARTKTAMLTVATWADVYRIGGEWHRLLRWRDWQHGRQVHEVSHLGEYTTGQGDVLAVCPVARDEVVCQVQVVEIRMVDCDRLTDEEIRDLGYATRQQYHAQWIEDTDSSPKGWYMSIMLVPEDGAAIH
jgi:hypothetical protein